jgi:hypothetical protein
LSCFSRDECCANTALAKTDKHIKNTRSLFLVIIKIARVEISRKARQVRKGFAARFVRDGLLSLRT